MQAPTHPDNTPPVAMHLSIVGRVQGVGYRDALRAAALSLGIAGWVRNRDDGSVEATLQGSREACESVLSWARRGPPAARVDRVGVRPASAAEVALVERAFARLPTI